MSLRAARSFRSWALLAYALGCLGLSSTVAPACSMSCTLVGCRSGVSFSLTPDTGGPIAPGTYTIQISGSGFQHFLTCDTSDGRQCCSGGEDAVEACLYGGEAGAREFTVFVGGEVPELRLVLKSNDKELLATTVGLHYGDYYPNGEDCEPVCRAAPSFSLSFRTETTSGGADAGIPVCDAGYCEQDGATDAGPPLCGDRACEKNESCRCGRCRPTYCLEDDDCNPGQMCVARVCKDLYLKCNGSNCDETPEECTCQIGEQKCVPIEGKSACHYVSGGPACECPEGMRCFNTFCVAGIPCNGGCPTNQVCLTDRNECVPAPDECTSITCGEGQIKVFRDPATGTYDACEKIECSCEDIPPADGGVGDASEAPTDADSSGTEPSDAASPDGGTGPG